MKRCTRDHQVRTVADPVLGLPWLKRPEQHGPDDTAEVLRLRATRAVSCDKSVRRSAQDDGFVGILTKVERKVLSISSGYGDCRNLLGERIRRTSYADHPTSFPSAGSDRCCRSGHNQFPAGRSA